jgi:uncharacterized protein (AIM24 family)
MEQYLDDKQQEAIREKVSVASAEEVSFGESDKEADAMDVAMGEDVDERSEDRSRRVFQDAEGDDDDDEFDDLSFNITESDGEETQDVVALDDNEAEDDDDEDSIDQRIDEDAATAVYNDKRRTHSASGVIARDTTVSMFRHPVGMEATPQGHKPSRAVSQLAAERMVRPSEGGQPLEVGPGGVLVARVTHRLISRTQGVMVSSGELGFEPATRRIRGRQTDEVFGSGDAQLFVVTGEGYLVASACGEIFSVVHLDGDVVYVREEYVFAFDPNLRWENGRVPGSELHVAQFRGDGCVAIRSPNDLLSVQLSAENVVYVESEVLAGWIGPVVPRVVKPAAGGRASTPFVECSGEGIVLLHDLRAPK